MSYKAVVSCGIENPRLRSVQQSASGICEYLSLHAGPEMKCFLHAAQVLFTSVPEYEEKF